MRNQVISENAASTINTPFVAVLDCVTKSQGVVGSAPPT
jgi:hypothetical protein